MSSDESDLTPESIKLDALGIVHNLLPEKSKEKYLKAYNDFDKWKTAKVQIDIDFNNAQGFVGRPAAVTEANFIVYFLSHSMMFCTGALIEAHVVLTPASCVYAEKFKFKVFGGTHSFVQEKGKARIVEHMCIHTGYNHTDRWRSCSPDNLAMLLLNAQYHLHQREPSTEYILNRVRYGAPPPTVANINSNCRFYGWGSRRNGYLVPLLLHLYRVDVILLPREACHPLWNYGDKYLCMEQPICKDDMGSVIVCSGFLRGVMVSHLMDRPCGVGFLDMSKYIKFLTCGVDDSRDVIGFSDYRHFDFDEVISKPPTRATVKFA